MNYFHIDSETVRHFFFYILPILVIGITIHEFAHCWITDRLGDDTPRRQGRITLSPLQHLDPMGTVFMVLSGLSGFGIGWGRSSPFDQNNFRNPARDRMLTAIAGPISNILQMLAWGSLGLLITALAPNSEGGVVMYFFQLCIYGMFINAALAVFNLIPVYPLDGHHILSFLAPPSWRDVIDNPKWMYVFIFLIFTGALRFISPVVMVMAKYASLLIGWPPSGIFR